MRRNYQKNIDKINNRKKKKNNERRPFREEGIIALRNNV